VKKLQLTYVVTLNTSL